MLGKWNNQTGRKYVQALQFQSCDVWSTLRCVWFVASHFGLLNSWFGSPLLSVKCFLRKARSAWLAERMILMTLGCHWISWLLKFKMTRWIIDIHEDHEDIALHHEIDITLWFWRPEKLITITWILPSKGAWCDTLTLWRWRLHCFLTPKIRRSQEEVYGWKKRKRMLLMIMMVMMNDWWW